MSIFNIFDIDCILLNLNDLNLMKLLSQMNKYYYNILYRVGRENILLYGCKYENRMAIFFF